MIASSPKTAKRRRLEGKIIGVIAPLVRDRDGFCRLANKGLGACQGYSEWCHWGPFQRFKTRRMDPELRHTTAGSFQGCSRHHRAYDRGEFALEPLTERLCDGQLRLVKDGQEVGEV